MRPLPTARVPDLGSTDRLGFPDARGWDRAETLPPLVGAEDDRSLALPTALLVGATREALCVRFDCGGGVPPCTLAARGTPLWTESAVEVFVAAGGGVPKTYLEVETNPAGALFDAVVSNPDGQRRTLRLLETGGADVAVRASRPGPDRWIAEIVVAWRTIPGARGIPEALRANFFRIQRRSSGPPIFAAWSATFVAPADFHKPSRFGFLVRA